ncbi:MAG: hypothetical protein HC794_01185 [Nitrospiraceae bacterium]|nr:hypothetical protein [Nitrospiraceae bacterium]
MSKASKSAATLNTQAVSKVVRSVGEAITSIGTSANIVTQVCSVVRSVSDGALAKEDIDAIIGDVAKLEHVRKMNPKTRDNVLSKWRTVAMTADQLPAAEKALRDRMGRASWHDAMALASLLRKGKSVKDAVSTVADRMNGKAAEATKADHAKRTASALKAWFTSTKGDKREAIRKAAAILSLNIA